jgi:hypothetical protein
MKIYIFILALVISLFFLKSMNIEKVGHTIFVPPSKNIQKYSLGYDNLISSLLWVRVVQDIDICDQKEERVNYPEIKTEGDEVLSEILKRDMPQSRCSEGWVYQMLDVITDLTPTFNAVYTDGATFLSVLVDDRLGAQKIFEKGQVYYPESWEVYYRSAYHELFEMQNPGKAAILLKRAGEKGAPRWVFALSAKLLTKIGQAEFAKTILENVLRKKEDSLHTERLKAQLKRIDEVLQNQKPEK